MSHFEDGVEPRAGAPGDPAPTGESADPAVTYRVAIDGGSPEAALAEMRLLNELEDASRSKVQLLVAELIDHLGDLHNGDRPKGLEVQLQPGLVRVTGRSAPEFPSAGSTGPPHKAWRLITVERIADRWGVDDDGNGERRIWFEIDRDTDRGAG